VAFDGGDARDVAGAEGVGWGGEEEDECKAQEERGREVEVVCHCAVCELCGRFGDWELWELR
jgi:hypothetical protein